MLFIVGTGRCGTNMIRDLLNLHRNVFIPQETHWWPILYREYGLSVNRIEDYCRVVNHCHYHFGQTTLEEILKEINLSQYELYESIAQLIPSGIGTMRDFADAFYKVVMRNTGAKLSGDKTPEYGSCLYDLSRLWPDARFIHIVRDCPAVARSMAKHDGFELMAKFGVVNWTSVAFSPRRNLPLGGLHGRTLKRILHIPPKSGYRIPSLEASWLAKLRKIRDEMSRIAKTTVLEVRYEDIIADPKASITRLAEFIGLKIEPSWLAETISSVRPSSRSTTLSVHYSDEIEEMRAIYGYGGG